MATHYDDAHRIVISDNDARGGVTGHNVRYVLAFGMTGVIAALATVAIYLGFDRLEARIEAAFAQNPSDVLQSLAPYATIILAGTMLAGFLLGVWTLLSGRSGNASQGYMRLRVVTQFALICVMMAILYMSAA